MSTMVNIEIDGRKLQVHHGTTVLEAARAEGIDIPTLCYHKDLSPYGACRLCMVETVQGPRSRIEASCLRVVSEGLVVRTDTEQVKSVRKMMLKLHLARCPDSEEIRTLAEKYGVTSTRIVLKEKDTCVLCGLCVRVCAEVTQQNALGFTGRGARRKVSTPFDKESPVCIGCGACAYVCPTKTIKVEEL